MRILFCLAILSSLSGSAFAQTQMEVQTTAQTPEETRIIQLQVEISKLRKSIEILTEAFKDLKKAPNIQAEISGHTPELEACGTSDCREFAMTFCKSKGFSGTVNIFHATGSNNYNFHCGTGN